MSNYNSQLQSNNTNLQTVLQTLQNKAAGGEELEIALIEDTLTNYSNNRVTAIKDYAFCTSPNLVAVSFPAVETIGAYAFSNCSRLKTINFPNASIINSNAFRTCDSLTSVNFPAVKTIGSYAFSRCANLTTLSFPEATTISTYAFSGCSLLSAASFPKAIDLGEYTFAFCSKLASADFPVAYYVGANMFRGCSMLAVANFPGATFISAHGFYGCTQLASLSFPAVSKIGGYAFNGCRALSALTLKIQSVCTLSNSNAFASTPYAGYSAYFSGIPYIYVPASLVESYKTATNWTYFSSYFSAIQTPSFYCEDIFGISHTFEMEIGMTWDAFINSDYNSTLYFTGGGNNVYDCNGFKVLNSSNVPVLLTDQIVNGTTYHLET